MVEEQQSAAIVQDSFVSHRHGNATSVNILAGSGRSCSPAANVNGQQPAAISHHSLRSRRHGTALNVNVTDVSEGH
jgi:hypothetical protein